MERPKVADIADLKTHLEEVWANARSRWTQYDSFYHREFALWPTGSSRRVYRPSTATNLIDHAADTQLAFEPKVYREPVGKSREAREAADRVEVALTEVMRDSQLRAPSLTWKQAGRYLVHYGYAVIDGPVWVDDDEHPRPRKAREETDEEHDERLRAWEASLSGYNPIRIRVPHPSSVLMNPLERMPTEAVRVSVRYAQDVERLAEEKKRTRKYADLWDRGERKAFDEVEVTEFWSPWWHSVQVGAEPLYVEKNPWEFVPYHHGFSGFGQERMGLTTIDPAYMAVGFLHPVMDSLRAHAQAQSAKLAALFRSVFTPLMTPGDPGELQQQLAHDIIHIDEKDAVSWLQYPEIARSTFQVTRELEADIESGTYTAALSGRREEGVTTVGQQVMLSTAAARKFAAMAAQMDQLATIAASRILRMVWVRGQEIRVGGVVLRPSDIDGNFNVRVNFEVLDPVLHMQSRDVGMREFQLGLKSDITYWEDDARLTNVSQEQQRLLDMAVRRSPIVQLLLQEKVLRGTYNMPEAADQARAQAEALLGGPPGPQAPGTGEGMLGEDGRMPAEASEVRGYTPQVPKPPSVTNLLQRGQM